MASVTLWGSGPSYRRKTSTLANYTKFAIMIISPRPGTVRSGTLGLYELTSGSLPPQGQIQWPAAGIAGLNREITR
jgi:hypothetical protein